MKRMDEFDAYYSRKYAGYLLPALAKVMESSLGLEEKDQVIRWVADGSLAAAARGRSCRWSGALRRQVFGRSSLGQETKAGKSSRLHRKSYVSRKGRVFLRRRLILGKCCSQEGRRSAAPAASSAVDGRMEALKDLLPGGSLIANSMRLLQEAVDYMMFLEVQVRVLKALAAAAVIHEEENRD